MTVDRSAVAAWCTEHLESHTNTKAKVLLSLPALGIEVGADDKSMVLVAEGRSVRLATNTWQDDFDRLLARGLPLLVLKPTAEWPITFYDEHGEAITVKADGNPVSAPAYAVVREYEPPAGWYGSWLHDTPEARAALTIDGVETVGALARLLTGTNPANDYQGRGKAFQAALRAIEAQSVSA